VLERIAGLEDGERSLTERVFAWQPLPAGAYPVGPFRLQSWSLPHYVPNAGVRLSTPELIVAYTGDTGPDPALADVGREPTCSSSTPPTATSAPATRAALNRR
jgi:hypothetical protein